MIVQFIQRVSIFNVVESQVRTKPGYEVSVTDKGVEVVVTRFNQKQRVMVPLHNVQFIAFDPEPISEAKPADAKPEKKAKA